MNFIRSVKLSLLLALAVLLIGLCIAPTPAVHSHEVAAAYSRYLSSPTRENRLEYESTVHRANRPLHILQYVSGLAGLILLGVTLRRSAKASREMRS